jgi:hypothetical protein
VGAIYRTTDWQWVLYIGLQYSIYRTTDWHSKCWTLYRRLGMLAGSSSRRHLPQHYLICQTEMAAAGPPAELQAGLHVQSVQTDTLWQLRSRGTSVSVSRPFYPIRWYLEALVSHPSSFLPTKSVSFPPPLSLHARDCTTLLPQQSRAPPPFALHSRNNLIHDGMPFYTRLYIGIVLRYTRYLLHDGMPLSAEGLSLPPAQD